MRVRDVESFWKRFADPVLRKSGFRRRGRQYVADGPLDRRAVLDFLPTANGGIGAFEVTYGVTTAEHVHFLEDQGFPPGDWPLPSDALMRAKLVSPEFARVGAPWRVASSDWILGESSPDAAVGAALAQAIVDDMIPRIKAWYEPAGIARALRNPPAISFPGLVPIERAIAMALLEVEEEDGQLAGTLSFLPPDDFVRRWIENRSAELASG